MSSLIEAIPQSIKEMGRIRAGQSRNKAAFGQSLADLGRMAASIPTQMRQQEAFDAQQRRGAQQEQLGAMEIAEKTRDAAAETALGNAMTNALAADGSLDVGKLQAALAGTPAAGKLPQIMQAVNAMNKTAMDLKSSGLNVAEAEADHMGALAAAAMAAPDPDGKAGIITAGIAHGVKAGLIDPAHAKAATARMLGDDGLPDPGKVDALLKEFQAESSKQRQLTKQEMAADAQAGADKARMENAQSDTLIQKDKAALDNYGRQLAKATAKDQYVRIFQGVPANLRDYFDAPEAWTKDSGERARRATMTAAELERERNDTLMREEAARHNRETEEIGHINAERTRGTAADEFSTAAKRGYDAFVENYTTRYPTETTEMVEEYKDGPKKPVKTPVKGVLPPPSMEKWSAMTPAERQAVLADPQARISDAELASRQGGAKPTAPAVKAVAPQTITMADVEKAAKVLKVSVEEAKKRAEAEGFTVK